jgi:hypothetical protein
MEWETKDRFFRGLIEAADSRLRQDCLPQTVMEQQHGPWYLKSKGSHDWSFEAQ